jgi:diguanylate cyclase (GGDEF)-like protein
MMMYPDNVVYLELTIFTGLSLAISYYYFNQYRALYKSIVRVLNNVPGGIVIATHRPNIVLCNRLVADTLGLSPVKAGELQNFDLRDNAVLTSICTDLFDAPLEPTLEARSFEIIDQHGEYHRWDRHVSSYRINGRDLPAIFLADRTEVERLTQRLEQSDSHDALTGLANRDLFHDRFDQALETAARNGTVTAVLVAEIDQFETIQEEHGWEAAKRAVIEMAARLETTTRAADTLARIGQNSFAILLTGMKSGHLAHVAAKRFLEAANSSANIRRGSPAFEISTSIGIACAPRDGSTSIRLLEKATQACLRAQYAGGAVTMAYDAILDDNQFAHGWALLAEMRHAFADGQFFVEYQPIVDLRTRRPVHYEALLRWQHPEKGLIPPTEFITAAEHSGFIHELGDFVLQTACRDASQWPIGIGVSVNASVIELMSGEWPLHLVEVLAHAGQVTDRLSIEITETSAISSLIKLGSVTRQLQRLNVGVLLDDFGTGHSSLAQLRNLEFGGIKIDRQFIYDLDDPRCSEIVRMLVDYCAPRGLMIVAEGVESASQVARLAEWGCTHAQGFYFGRPVPQASILNQFRRVDRAVSLSAAR